MDSRRGGRRWGNHTLLPLHPSRRLSNTISCWYCDFKFMAFNDSLFRFGRSHSRYLRAWFSMGIGFSLAALVGVTVIILCGLAKAPLLYAGNAWSADSLFGFSFPIAGMNVISISNMIYLCSSSVVCVIVHELGHALAAASEGVQMEYVAFFCTLLFPGALVAFNHSSLQALSGVASLRIYCAGIWHNAAFCGVCSLALFLLPFILSPFYIHGDSPMVLDVHSTSPLSGYLSPLDVIVSVDEFRMYTVEDWNQIINVLTEQTHSLTSGRSSEIANLKKSYCIPHSLIEESIYIQFEGDRQYCPNELIAFASVPCQNMSRYSYGNNKNNEQKGGDIIHCLNAKDVIKLRKCAHSSLRSPTNKSACVCSQDESCLMPVQLPGLGWVEITHSRLECVNRGRSLFSDDKHSSTRDRSCHQTFVFVGDVFAMAHSVRLTSYQPRFSNYFIAYLPLLLEKLFTCAFHVSMVLALLNSLPVFFLDGESILEVILLHYFGFLSSKTKRLVLRCSLLVGTLLSILLFLQIFFVSII